MPATHAMFGMHPCNCQPLQRSSACIPNTKTPDPSAPCPAKFQQPVVHADAGVPHMLLRQLLMPNSRRPVRRRRPPEPHTPSRLKSKRLILLIPLAPRPWAMRVVVMVPTSTRAAPIQPACCPCHTPITPSHGSCNAGRPLVAPKAHGSADPRRFLLPLQSLALPNNRGACGAVITSQPPCRVMHPRSCGPSQLLLSLVAC